jgi:hypothetical protein
MMTKEELKALEKLLQYIARYPEEFKGQEKTIEAMTNYIKGLHSTGSYPNA